MADPAHSLMQWPHQFSGLQFNYLQFNDLQFNDLRRKAKFIAAKTALRTNKRGITPGPKAAARATIHSTIATVKIVQNTALPPERVVYVENLKPGYELRRLETVPFKGFESAKRFKLHIPH